MIYELHANMNSNYKPICPKNFKMYIHIYAQFYDHKFCLSILMIASKPYFFLIPSFPFYLEYGRNYELSWWDEIFPLYDAEKEKKLMYNQNFLYPE
jgi:hypothetical protein